MTKNGEHVTKLNKTLQRAELSSVQVIAVGLLAMGQSDHDVALAVKKSRQTVRV